MNKQFIILTLFTFYLGSIFGQSSTFIDDEGLVRWSDSTEVCAFGTNYAIPFSYWKWREPIGVDYKKAIEEDVYHMSRLGLDGYRLHVWPDFICDSIGNLTFNEHLHWFDYLIYNLKKRDIKLFITPMYLSEGVNGFIKKAGGKMNCINDTANWKYQERFLTQFVSHVNPYTGLALKDDPDVIAMAITNEPSHWKRPDLVKDYINTLYSAMRKAGVICPIFYNMTTCSEYIDDVLASGIQGGTFQWYPTGLTSNHNQKGNLLPNVDKYYIPFEDKLKETKRAKFVYEYSPSDMNESAIMYPAMARSFREAGFQFAAHFAYDPLHAAYCNVEYKTHFFNLAYTPKKAIGLKIAKEAFHNVRRYDTYGRFPNNNSFESVNLSYEKNIAELVNETQFFNSNSTNTLPLSADKLEEVAGVGNSPIVKYAGNGIYMLDKIEDGVWRLEVMPDAHLVKDAFFVPSVKRETAVCISREHQMQINLPNLGNSFEIKGLNQGNTRILNTSNATFKIVPGAYLLTKEGVNTSVTASTKFKTLRLGEFHEPERKPQKDYILHSVPTELSINKAAELSVKIVSEIKPDKVELIVLGYGKGEAIAMNSEDGYNYSAQISQSRLNKSQILRYNISIEKEGVITTYPSGEAGEYLLDRRIYGDDRTIDDGKPYEVRVVNKVAPIILFDADRDWQYLTKQHRRDKIDIVPSNIPGKSEMQVLLKNFKKNANGYTIRSYFGDAIEDRSADLKSKRQLLFHGSSIGKTSCKIQIALLQKNGSAFGATLNIEPNNDAYSVDLRKLKQVKSVLLPRPFPNFQAYFFKPDTISKFKIEEIESIQISFVKDDDEFNMENGVVINWVVLK